MQPPFDFHLHSNHSDGAYAPPDLVARIQQAGVTVFALTDHDTVAGCVATQRLAKERGLGFVSGVEISVSWQGRTIHVIGLGIALDHMALLRGLERLSGVREARAREMGERLEKCGIQNAHDQALALAGGGMITRTHFARMLVARGYALDVRDVFRRYLVPGKPGYVSVQWAEMQEAVDWILGSGGIPVLAHPMRYPLTGSWLRRLGNEFKEMGGQAVEVLSGQCSPGDVQSSAALARRLGLMASAGSDFHGPDENWPKLGRLPAMPEGLDTVWSVLRSRGPEWT